MSNLQKEVIEAVSGELRSAGVDFEIDRSQKHLKFKWASGQTNRMFVTSLSPSDFRAPMNAKHDVRRMLREDGLLDVDTTPNLYIVDGGVFCSSLDLATHFGKIHRDVMRSIDSLIDHLDSDFGLRNFAQTSYTDKSNRQMRCYNMTRKGFSLVAMGFTGKTAIKWKVSYLEAFDAMEAKLAQSTVVALPPSDIQDMINRIMALEGDCAAMAELLMERREPVLPPPIKVRKAPFIRPSVLRRSKKTVIEINIGSRK